MSEIGVGMRVKIVFRSYTRDTVFDGKVLSIPNSKSKAWRVETPDGRSQFVWREDVALMKCLDTGEFYI